MTKADFKALYRGKLRTESKPWGPCQTATSLEEVRSEKENKLNDMLRHRITAENLSNAEDTCFTTEVWPEVHIDVSEELLKVMQMRD